MARKKTPPEYGLSPCIGCQLRCGFGPGVLPLSKRSNALRTGPMIVACQWNYTRLLSVHKSRRRCVVQVEVISEITLAI